MNYAIIWDTEWVDDDRTKVGLQHPKEKNFALGIAYAWWNEVDIKPSCWTVRRPTPMTTWKPISTQSTWNNDVTHVNVRAVVCHRSLALSHSFLAHIAWLKMSECLSHLIHAWSERLFWLPWSLHHLHLPSLIPHQPQPVPATLQLPRG